MAETPVRNYTYKNREDSANITLLIFHPHQQLGDLVSVESCWGLFHKKLKQHRKEKQTICWKQGFSILQNIQDRMIMDKSMSRAVEKLQMT